MVQTTHRSWHDESISESLFRADLNFWGQSWVPPTMWIICPWSTSERFGEGGWWVLKGSMSIQVRRDPSVPEWASESKADEPGRLQGWASLLNEMRRGAWCSVYLRRAISSRSSPLLTHFFRCLEWNLSSLLCSFYVLKWPSPPVHHQVSLTSGWADSKLQAPRGVPYDPLHPAQTSRPSKDISPVFYSPFLTALSSTLPLS